MDTLKWGTDYLLRTLAKQKVSAGDKFPVYLIAYQVGNYTLDNSRWERPEMIKDSRPVYYVTTRNGERPLARRHASAAGLRLIHVSHCATR